MSVRALSAHDRRHQHLGRQGRGLADHRADDRGVRRGLQALHPERADGVDLRPREHAVRLAVHALPAPTRWRRTPMCAATSSTARCARARRPRSILCCTSSFSFPASPRSSTPATITPRDSWRINEHSNVTADGPPVYHFKMVIPIAGALVMLQGIRRDRALRRLPQDRGVAEPAQGRRRDRRHRGAARTQRIRRRGDAQDRDRARASKSTKPRASAGMGGDLKT